MSRSCHGNSGAHRYQPLGNPTAAAAAASAVDEEDKFGRITVPIFSTKWAIVLCVCNFLVPGLGTCLAGLSLCCPCSDNPSFGCSDCCCSAWLQFGVAALQLLLTPACLLGWVWSCVWGCAFIGRSNPEWRAAHRHHRQLQRDASAAASSFVTTEQPSSAASSPAEFLLGRSFLLRQLGRSPSRGGEQQLCEPLPPAYHVGGAVSGTIGDASSSRSSPPPSYAEAVAQGVPSNDGGCATGGSH